MIRNTFPIRIGFLATVLYSLARTDYAPVVNNPGIGRTGRFLRHLATVSLVGLVAFLMGGCARVPSTGVQTFSSALTAAKAQTSLAFQDVTSLTAEAIIEHAAAQKTLNDSHFIAVLDPESVGAWERAFTALEAYSRALTELTSPNLTREYKAAVLDLARQIQATGSALNVEAFPGSPEASGLLATGFTKLGDILLRAKAQRDARRILERTDPVVHDILANMAGAIGQSHKQGIRGTVHAHWDQLKGEIQVRFTRAVQTNDDSKRRDLAREYAALMSQQRVQDLSLAALRRSFLALADAHRALSEGTTASVVSSVSVVLEEARDAKLLYGKFKDSSKSGTKNAHDGGSQ